MKNRLKIENFKHPDGKKFGLSILECYVDHKDKYNGFYKSLWLDGSKYEGQNFKGRSVGVWKCWFPNGKKEWVDTNKNNFMNGIKIKFL